MIDFKKLIDARVHFGHKSDRWSPRMKPYIWGKKSGVHLIDVSKTAFQLERAAKFLESVAAQDKQILWVGTKRAAQETIKLVGTELKMPYVNHRWIGGTLTNWPQVKRSVTKMMHFEDVVNKADKFPHYTKKELNEMKKNLEKLQTIVNGIRNLKYPVAALVVVDVSKEATAIKEASKMGIPVVGIVDTNGDPSAIDYVIPANDDAPRSIEVLIEYLKESVERGKAAVKETEAKKEAAIKAEAEKKAAAHKKTKEAGAAVPTAEQKGEKKAKAPAKIDDEKKESKAKTSDSQEEKK